jgi:hypothetical protein
VGFSFLAGAAVLAFTAGFFLAVAFTIFFFAAGLWAFAFALVFDLVMAFLRLATYRGRRRNLRLQANGRSSDLAFDGPADGDLGPTFQRWTGTSGEKNPSFGSPGSFP